MIDRLKYGFAHLPRYRTSVPDAHAGLSDFLERLNCDALFITSQDEFLTECLPRENNQRYALSAFDGSAGFGIFLGTAVAHRLGLPRFVLFVDGRYHLQAERQCDATHVQIEKLPLGVSIVAAMAKWLTDRADTIGYDARRLSVSQRKALLDATKWDTPLFVPVDGGEMDRAIRLPGWRVDRPIFELPETVTGRRVEQNIAQLNQHLVEWIGNGAAKTCFVTSVADDLSYLLNSRGYHQPNTSSHLGFLFVIGERLVLFLPETCAQCPVELRHCAQLEIVRNDTDELRRLLGESEVDHLCFGPSSLNCALLDWATGVWPQAQHVEYSPVEMARASKTSVVLDQFRDAFARSSAAIAETMRWAKYGEPGQSHSEYDLARKINDAYGTRGAVAQSFRSVAANGANSATPHYMEASADVPLTEGELVLLDSGAYYGGGFATDCTRVVLRKTSAATTAQPWQREIYTVALKACIKGLTTCFPADATGDDVDRLVRSVCVEHGYDFGHGTGHGVGIHVHEGGIRFAPGSAYGLTESAVVSIEPGVYLPGKGGVRIENIVIVHRHARDPGKVEFENMVTVGYDWDLIDLDLLTEHERAYLMNYERTCREWGTTVSECPLLTQVSFTSVNGE